MRHIVNEKPSSKEETEWIRSSVYRRSPFSFTRVVAPSVLIDVATIPVRNLDGGSSPTSLEVGRAMTAPLLRDRVAWYPSGSRADPRKSNHGGFSLCVRSCLITAPNPAALRSSISAPQNTICRNMSKITKFRARNLEERNRVSSCCSNSVRRRTRARRGAFFRDARTSEGGFGRFGRNLTLSFFLPALVKRVVITGVTSLNGSAPFS